MGRPRKDVLLSNTTATQAKATIGTGGTIGALLLAAQASGVNIPPEVATVIMWLLTTVIAPLVSRWLAGRR